MMRYFILIILLAGFVSALEPAILDVRFENNFADLSGNTLNVFQPVGFSPGIEGSSGNFSGGYIEISNFTNIEKEITISAWVYKSIDSVEWTSILMRQEGAGFEEPYLLGFYNNKPAFAIKTETSEYVTSSSDMKNNEWHHIAGVYNGSEFILYVDGVETGRKAKTGNLTNSSSDVFIGVERNNKAIVGNFNGLIDNLLVYNQALSPAEIAALSNYTFVIECGNNKLETGEECDDGNIISGDGCSTSCKVERNETNISSVCFFPKSVTATSENLLGSLASYALTKNAPQTSCSIWSGYGYSWTPASWNVQANITLSYDSPVKVSNFTIFGDYDMCWNNIWLYNSYTDKTLNVPVQHVTDCTFTKQLDANFTADTIILETCGWNWGSTDAVEICGVSNSSIPVEPEKNKTYVIAYLGDIDGAKNQSWFNFYNRIADFYMENNITSSVSFFPSTLSQDTEFKNAFQKFQNSGEIIQKGFNGSTMEYNHDALSMEEQRLILESGKSAYADFINTSGLTKQDITTYDLIGGRFTEQARKVTEAGGINFYFDIYYADDLGPVNSTEYYDVLQYTVSFTDTGEAGSAHNFRTKQEIINEIKNFSRDDVDVMKINGVQVVPLAVHQQDFETPSGVNETKWQIFTETMLELKKDPNVIFITPSQIHKMLHGSENPSVCGNGKLETGEECDDGNFAANYSCNALCRNEINGSNQSSECFYPSFASADSENLLGSLASYALTKNAPQQSCTWSGFGYSWSPENWNVKGTLTLKYPLPVKVSNFTIFGDYDMCWNNIWLYNSYTDKTLNIPVQHINNCTFIKQLDANFTADTIILETCGWNWGSTDAVEICGLKDQEIPKPPVKAEICAWKNCENGAASVSVDDYFTSCMAELERNGMRGTYFLSDTNYYTADLWEDFNLAFSRGHEIGTHTQSHYCVDTDDEFYIQDLENNLQDIVDNTNISRQDIVSHAHPCGYYDGHMGDLIAVNFNFTSARGYNFNSLEEKVPEEIFNLKSFNTLDYGDSVDLFNAIDSAEAQGKWINLVFHVECDSELINYLPQKSLWVDTVGHVVSYINLREAASITNLTQGETEIRFNINFDKTQDQTLSVKVTDINTPSEVLVCGENTAYTYLNRVLIFEAKPQNCEVIIR